ncbi:hypothetical protein AcW1_002557 [Taiwanofungus camphoratus]|nr:hypothetical protein AcV5_009789 [Antrodia cinnamomea]KAI0926457.1 hypothetical protein AcV7_005391 [Antrodia cinnamomea]KAI0943385.1 hypothetical protein AcW1_002557 [Antrodia cinnamomea]
MKAHRPNAPNISGRNGPNFHKVYVHIALMSAEVKLIHHGLYAKSAIPPHFMHPLVHASDDDPLLFASLKNTAQDYSLPFVFAEMQLPPEILASFILNYCDLLSAHATSSPMCHRLCVSLALPVRNLRSDVVLPWTTKPPQACQLPSTHIVWGIPSTRIAPCTGVHGLRMLIAFIRKNAGNYVAGCATYPIYSTI